LQYKTTYVRIEDDRLGFYFIFFHFSFIFSYFFILFYFFIDRVQDEEDKSVTLSQVIEVIYSCDTEKGVEGPEIR